MKRHPAPADIAVALVIGLVSMQSASDGDELKSPAWAVVALIQLTALPLAWRRIWPFIPVPNASTTASCGLQLRVTA